MSKRALFWKKTRAHERTHARTHARTHMLKNHYTLNKLMNNRMLVSIDRKIDKLRVCYTDVFKTKCGDNAGDVIGQLIAKAFQDPFYLRMQYRPHCSRHKRPKIPVAHATNEQLITKTFGGSFVEENSPGVETTTRTYKREAVRTRSDTSSSARSGSTTAHASVALLCLLVVVGLW